MASIFVKRALIGKDLIPKENISITFEKKKITEITIGETKRKADFSFEHHLLTPAFINSHVHCADAIAKDQAFGYTLDAAVGKGGIKFQALREGKHYLSIALKTAIQCMLEAGVSTFADFREGGKPGVITFLKAAEGWPIRTKVFGRPNSDLDDLNEVINVADGIGISSPLDYEYSQLEVIARSTKRAHKPIATHVLESKDITEKRKKNNESSDLELALHPLKAQKLIHLTHATSEDIARLTDQEHVILCPRSNIYFQEGFPPITTLMKKGVLISLGTDNVMINNPNPLEEVRTIIKWLLLQKTVPNLSEILKMITVNAAKVLGVNTGEISIGKKADLCIWNLNSPRTIYSQDPLRALIFRVRESDLSCQFFEGEHIK
ncbi:MAG: amidohydrolase family protein [Candidatus Hodarchaeota archaeon]